MRHKTLNKLSIILQTKFILYICKDFQQFQMIQ